MCISPLLFLFRKIFRMEQTWDHRKFIKHMLPFIILLLVCRGKGFSNNLSTPTSLRSGGHYFYLMNFFVSFKQLHHNNLLLYPHTNFYIIYFFISPSHKFIICVRIGKKPTNVLTIWRLKTSICVKCWPLYITIAMLFRI